MCATLTICSSMVDYMMILLRHTIIVVTRCCSILQADYDDLRVRPKAYLLPSTPSSELSSHSLPELVPYVWNLHVAFIASVHSICFHHLC